MTSLRFRLSAAALPLAAAALAIAAACGVAAAKDDDDTVHVIGANPAAGDTGLVIEERPTGRLQATVGTGHGRSMVIFGPNPGTGSLGFTYRYGDLAGKEPGTRPTHHATITGVAPGSQAERAGLRTGDELLAVNGRDALEPWLLRDRTPGTAYDLRVRRGSAEQAVHVVVGPAPSREQVEWDLRRQAGCIRQAAGPATVGMGDGLTACALMY